MADQMQERETVQCPYCFESIEVWIDPGESGVLIRDCDVCCNPLELRIDRPGGAHRNAGSVRVRVRRAQ